MAKKKQEEEQPPAEGWLTSYADLMSLLLIFFILMFAMANSDLKNFARVAEALRLAFSGVGNNPNASVLQDINNAANKEGSAASAPIFFDRLPTRQRDFIKASTELTILAEQLGVGGQISVNTNYEGVIISLSDELVFESGQATVRPEAAAVLDKVVEILLTTDNRVRVEGHTDDIPTNSPLYPSNWELSVARAVSIVRYLSEVGGVPPERVTAAGKAEFDPLVPNTNRANRARNRRADIVMIYNNASRQFSINLPGGQNDVPVGDGP